MKLFRRVDFVIGLILVIVGLVGMFLGEGVFLILSLLGGLAMSFRGMIDEEIEKERKFQANLAYLRDAYPEDK
ncbi:MAG: hypothetical protein G01um10143_532 [Parcubacteria group bacterium Gr01-1014_3]|nr:MAG: hypothetical protein G01um10143_532 [Parcubacteria group bacterium Gr01-1014_3]